ncbi:AzlC family ABC transporter permease [Sabulicella rubraurantiaca]|uniref:AzlC family ABC transporter permease n=1 Tax=Sabulicella rubraurantiaca TaxID=2811429 RepID=UPI002E29D001|nr:AzlC family ABC transporter permease [Sabulicella rubraurantiaca]
MKPGPVVFTRVGALRGARLAVGLLPAMVPFALVVGVVADSKGLSFLETVLMSALVFAGTSQIVALELWREPAPVLGATLAALVINLRLAPMGAALSPWLDRLRGIRLWGTLATLVDNTFAVCIADQRQGGRDAALLLGMGVTMWAGWTLMTGVGHAAAGLIRLPPGHPVFFAGIATILALMVPIWRGRGDAMPWVVAGIAAAAAHFAGLGPPWPVLAGALCGAAAGAWRDGRR